MENLIVVVYDDKFSALENMRTLQTLEDDWVVDIRDALAVVRDADGALLIQQTYKATPGEGARWGVLLGTILGGVGLAPLTGGLSAASAAGGALIGGVGGATLVSANKEVDGITEEFVSDVSTAIGRGQSAVFALFESYDPERVARYFRGTGGTIIRTDLDRDEQERAQQILDGRSSPIDGA